MNKIYKIVDKTTGKFTSGWGKRTYSKLHDALNSIKGVNNRMVVEYDLIPKFIHEVNENKEHIILPFKEA